MNDGDMYLCSGHGTCKGRVGIAIKHDVVRFLVNEDFLDAFGHAGSLHAMRGRTYMQVVVGMRDAQLVEKHLRHVFVLVLTGVDDDFRNPVSKTILDGAAQCSGLNDLGACPYDGDYLHNSMILPFSR